jgi:ribonucleoside-triphosphate reductase
MFRFVSDLNVIRSISQKKAVGKVIELFNRAPFFALWIAALTPIPFYPFRFLVVLARYPLTKYILALFLSRTPRFFALALLGHAIRIPDYLLSILFIALIIGIHLPLLRNIIKKKK